MAGDSLYQSVSLLLSCDGANGSTTFLDESPVPKAVAALGNAQVSTARSVFGGASALFDGTGDYLTVGDVSDFKHLHDDTTDYAVEGWAYWTGGDMTIISTAAASEEVGMLVAVQVTTGYLNAQIYRGVAGNTLSATSTTGVTLNTWTYFKFSYTKTSRAYAFRIGNAAAGSGSMTVGGSWPASSAANHTYVLAVGRYQYSTPAGYFNGNLDDLRITKAPRTETTAPTAAFIAGMGQVSGVIRDSASALCARAVRAYRRDTGALVASTTSNGTTGNYTLNCPTLDEVTVVALDNATSGTYYNDQAARVIPA